MFNKYLTLIGRTFIATFLTVNLFNIIPLDLRNNAWLTQVSMLFVDTGSILLLGLVSLKICYFTQNKRFSNNQYIDISDAMQNSSNEENTNVNFINKLSKFFMVFFIILGFFQSYLFVNGLRYINFEYSATYQEINNKYNKQMDKLESQFKNTEILTPEIENLAIKKNKYLKELDRNISRTRFILFKSNLKVFIMAFVWAFGLFKLSKIDIN